MSEAVAVERGDVSNTQGQTVCHLQQYYRSSCLCLYVYMYKSKLCILYILHARVCWWVFICVLEFVHYSACFCIGSLSVWTRLLVCVLVLCVYGYVCVSHINTHMKGFCLPILGPDLGFSYGCEVGPAHCQQSPTTAEIQKTSVGEK